jgi:hypothetical protein
MRDRRDDQCVYTETFTASTPRLGVRQHAQMSQLERANKGFAIQAVD